MAMSINDESSYVESLPLQGYPDGANVEIDDHGRTGSSPSTVSLPDVGEDFGMLPAPTRHPSTLPKTRAKKTSNSTIILLHGLVRCIVTWVLIAGFYLSLWLYKDRVISPGAKSVFDAINVALSIAFGLNIASSLKEIALDFRWWILGYRRRPSQEVEFILHCDSMTDLLKMMWTVPRLGTIAACMTWLAINMLAQTGIASLRDIGSVYKYSVLPEQKLDGSPWASNPAAFWNATDRWEYVSLNSTPSNYSNGPGMLSVYTDRIIRASGVCTTPAYQLNSTTIPATGSPAHNLPDYTIMAAEFTLLESGETVLFPPDALNAEGTYYLSSPYDVSVCGPGCGNIKVVESASGLSVENSTGVYFYECNITVTPSPDSFPGSLPPDQASLAARAIALSGAIPQLDGDWEYVFYNQGVAFGQAQNNSATGMASQLSRFAIGVIAAAAQTNQPKIVLGHVPTQGLRLTLDLPLAFDLILGLTGGIQLLLVLFTAIACGRLDIPEEMSLTRRETLKRFVLPG
ncbi:hypothetical protein OEA41_003108 [Lepraria neglecta]|uniref:Uncharacterized protein n=1 Tax=Lepraria neglecta TaxID=209136 RepID=A0AAE0DIL1_9LECA|nr:hypothetical protein OEA41_003108 [Lepraria neglecta]